MTKSKLWLPKSDIECIRDVEFITLVEKRHQKSFHYDKWVYRVKHKYSVISIEVMYDSSKAWQGIEELITELHDWYKVVYTDIK